MFLIILCSEASRALLSVGETRDEIGLFQRENACAVQLGTAIGSTVRNNLQVYLHFLTPVGHNRADQHCSSERDVNSC